MEDAIDERRFFPPELRPLSEDQIAHKSKVNVKEVMTCFQGNYTKGICMDLAVSF